MKNWSVEAKIAFVTLIVGIVFGAVAIINPEVRRFIGLEEPKSVSNSNSENGNETVNKSSNINNSSNKNSPTPTATPLPTITPLPAPTPISTNDFVFSLIDCRSLGDKISCSFTIKSDLNRLRKVNFYSKRFEPANTVILDERSRSLKQEFIQIANSQTNDDWATAEIPSGGIADGKIVFLKEKETEGKILSLVRLGFRAEGEGNPFNVEFNNVVIK